MGSPKLLSFAIYLYGPNAGPLPARFEEVARRLEGLDRLHFEWDGSFVWRGSSVEEPWQLDGMLYDLGDQIQYVDLKGCCPRMVWREWLEIVAVGGSDQLSILRLPSREVLDCQEFEEQIWGKSVPSD